MIKNLLSLVLIIVLTGCSQDEEPEIKKLLQVVTQPATNISPIKATLNGWIQEIGSTDIVDHGFIISESRDFPEGGTEKLSLGSRTDTGVFSRIVEGLKPQTAYYYRVYVKNGDGEIFVNSIQFETIAPNISGVEPAQGSSGEVVIISGVNFVAGMKVLFGDVEAEIVELTETIVSVIVPKGLGITSVTLTILIGEVGYSSSVEFLPIYGKWEQVADFPGVERTGPLCFTVGEKGYAGFGFDTSKGQYYNDFWEYDAINDSWKQLGDFPKNINSGEISRASFAIDGVGYVGIGFYSNEFWQYDVQDDLWLRVADFPGTQTGYVYWFVIDGKAYVGRGEAAEENREFWMYDPLIDTWTLKTTFSGKFAQDALCMSANDVGYIGLGSFRTDIWSYKLQTNSWEQMNDFPTVNRSNQFPTTFSINNKLYAGITYGGAGIGWDTNFWQYNEAEDSWIQLSSFPFAPSRFGQIVMTIDGNGYIGLGYDIGSNIYKFTPPSE